MLNFVVCDDNEIIKENVCNIITKLMIPIDIEYKTNCFSAYNKDFLAIINKKEGRKVYILDVEVGNHSGLDVARKIREKDWESVIIILTAHYELAYEAFKNRLLLLDFISKFDDYQKNIYETLKLAINIFNNKRQLTFKIGTILYQVDYGDILYIAKDELSRNTIIKTYSNEYLISQSLNEISKGLDHNFIRTHRACIANKDNIKTIDFKENKIIFKNGEKIDLLSKNYKKEVKKCVFS
jgi:DNA-binding LytR/AlgR family response regulator